jgi:hypothetical protein
MLQGRGSEVGPIFRVGILGESGSSLLSGTSGSSSTSTSTAGHFSRIEVKWHSLKWVTVASLKRLKIEQSEKSLFHYDVYKEKLKLKN